MRSTSVRFDWCPFCFKVLKLLEQSFSRHKKDIKGVNNFFIHNSQEHTMTKTALKKQQKTAPSYGGKIP
jgi:hypothetical protein